MLFGQLSLEYSRRSLKNEFHNMDIDFITLFWLPIWWVYEGLIFLRYGFGGFWRVSIPEDVGLVGFGGFGVWVRLFPIWRVVGVGTLGVGVFSIWWVVGPTPTWWVGGCGSPGTSLAPHLQM